MIDQNTRGTNRFTINVTLKRIWFKASRELLLCPLAALVWQLSWQINQPTRRMIAQFVKNARP